MKRITIRLLVRLLVIVGLSHAYVDIYGGHYFFWLCDCNAIKEIIEYNSSIHQLKKWTQQLLAYEFVIIHRVAPMIKDVDSVSRCVDSLVHQHNTTNIRLHTEVVTKRPSAYSFNVFIRCTNPRHVTAANALSFSITTSSITSISTLYHSPIKFSPVFPISLIPSIILPDPNPRIPSFPVIPPLNITWIYFDSVTNYFESILFIQEFNTLQHFICALGISLPIVSHLTNLVTRLSVIVLYFTGLLFNRCHLRILQRLLSPHSLMIHHGYPQFLTLDRLA